MPKDWKRLDRFWKETRDKDKKERKPPAGKKKQKSRLKLSIPSRKKRTHPQ